MLLGSSAFCVALLGDGLKTQAGSHGAVYLLSTSEGLKSPVQDNVRRYI